MLEVIDTSEKDKLPFQWKYLMIHPMLDNYDLLNVHSVFLRYLSN